MLAVEIEGRLRMDFTLSHTPPSIWLNPYGGGVCWKENADSQISLKLGLLSPQYWPKQHYLAYTLISRHDILPKSTFNVESLSRVFTVVLVFVSSFGIRSGHLFIGLNEATNITFLLKQSPAQHFGISVHWREVIMNISMYSWLFIQVMLCRLWCPVERGRLSSAPSMAGNKAGGNIKSFSTTACLPCAALRLI